ncbi:MAG: aconitate hydratase [Planctomycetota bacterium]|nr:aconitate hydratase [Planctomycetota bacterium]
MSGMHGTNGSGPFGARRTLTTPHGTYAYFALDALKAASIGHVDKLPFSIKVLLEAMLRNVDGFTVTQDDVVGLANWNAKAPAKEEIPFMPGRVVLQDFTGVPCVVDLAAMRDAMKALGGDPNVINPLVKCDLVIDHSVQVDAYGTKNALTINAGKEFERNAERYEFLKWGQQSLNNFTCVPPATGIVHQVNLEYLAQAVLTKATQSEHGRASAPVVYPDSCVGTDSHTTMINGLGVVGWGVGGIEAEAVMLGQPIYMLTPEVIGFKLKGKLPEGSTATDLVLCVTEMLRSKGVVDKFVEFFGPGLSALSVPDRATIANMAPEYGATMGFFPIDQATIDYMRFTGRDEATLALVEAYCKANGLWWTPGAPEPEFTDVIELDLSTVHPALAGPRRPQDRVLLGQMKMMWRKELVDAFGKSHPGEIVNEDRWLDEGGESGRVKASGETTTAATPPTLGDGRPVTSATSTAMGGLAGSGGAAATPHDGVAMTMNGRRFRLYHGDVVIAAITSCTNTSNPDVMIAAGLVARKARALGLTTKPWVKTSLAPGSKVVTEYFDKSGLTEDLDALGFHTVGYGCTTCIGNSGPLPVEIDAAIKQGDLVVASVLSGNRNFEGRVHPSVRANYLASPPLCVAYAIAGTVDIDLINEPIGYSAKGEKVFLKDIWPSHAEVQAVKARAVTPEQFRRQYAGVFTSNETWNRVPVSKSEQYHWNANSTYIQHPPYFQGMSEKPGVPEAIRGAKVLAFVGDSVTTDHISPAGDIAEASPAGEYLKSLGVRKADFNSYGSRRGNDRVMTRGTYANVRVKNKLAIDPSTGKIKEGGWTRDMSSSGGAGGKIDYIYNAAMNYKKEGTPLIVLAGKDYGMGSSRDWAAKGTLLLGCRAVIAESFERIHRSNLVGMGVLPLCFKPGQSASSLGLKGDETFDIHLEVSTSGEDAGLVEPRCDVKVVATPPAGGRTPIEFLATCRIDTPVEAEYYRNGGVLHTVLRRLLNESKKGTKQLVGQPV